MADMGTVCAMRMMVHRQGYHMCDDCVMWKGTPYVHCGINTSYVVCHHMMYVWAGFSDVSLVMRPWDG